MTIYYVKSSSNLYDFLGLHYLLEHVLQAVALLDLLQSIRYFEPLLWLLFLQEVFVA